MRFYHRLIRTLIIPNNAGPDDPQITIGPDIPPEIEAWVISLAGTVTIDALIVYRHSATEYVWEGVGSFNGAPTRFRGTYNPTFGVIVTQRTIIAALGLIERFGAGFNFTTQPSVDYIKGVDITYNTVSMGRGLAVSGFISSTAGAGPFAAETLILQTTGTVTFEPGRAYEVIFKLHAMGNLAYVDGLFHVRTTNLAGPLLLQASDWPLNNIDTAVCYTRTVVCNYTAAAIFVFVLLTGAAPLGGTVQVQALAASPYYLQINDIGAATDYPGMVQVS